MEVIYKDKELVVAVKPVGLDSELEFPEEIRQAVGGDIYPLHRLDKNVGGLMVYARTRQAAARLSRCIQEGNMVKRYVAMVHGTPPESGDWQDLLFKDSTKNKVFVVQKLRRGVKEARLEFTRQYAGPVSLVHIRLHTGRSHQIRVQFASRGFPLVGDHKYGARDAVAAPMLFSCGLSFPHGGQTVNFEAFPHWGLQNSGENLNLSCP